MTSRLLMMATIASLEENPVGNYVRFVCMVSKTQT